MAEKEEVKKGWGGTFSADDLSNIDFQNNGENRTKVFNTAQNAINKTAQDLGDNKIKGETLADTMTKLREAIAKNVDPNNPNSADNIFNFVSMNANFKDPNSYNVENFIRKTVHPKYVDDILKQLKSEQNDFTYRTRIEAPTTELVTPEGERTVEAQTVTDTKDVRAVGDLKEKNPSEIRELEGKGGKTTTTNYINQSEDKNNVVNEKQLKAIWDKDIEKGDAPTVKELEKVMTKEPGEKKEGKEDKEVAPTTSIKDKEIRKKIENIHRGIWRDFNNGMFGNVFKGKRWSELTDEEKAQRSDAWKTAFNFTVDTIGTMLWNTGAAFGRKGEPYMDTEYAKLLRQQNEGLIENEQYIRKQQAEWDSLLSRSEQFAELPKENQNAILSFLVTEGGDARNLALSTKLDRVGEATTRAMEVELSKLYAEIDKLLAETGVTNEQKNLLKEEIKSAAINNKYLPERIEKMLTGMGIQNWKGIMEAINTGMQPLIGIGKIATSLATGV